MKSKASFSAGELRYLRLLAQKYPTLQAAGNEVIRLEAILNLPKGTEHFMSDIHGEYEAFLHIMNSSSGEVKEKLKEYFGDSLSRQELNDLATLIYYPKAKLNLVLDEHHNLDNWYYTTLDQLARFCMSVTVKHTRVKIRSYLPAGYEQLIEDMITLCNEKGTLGDQYQTLLRSIIRVGQSANVIQAI